MGKVHSGEIGPTKAIHHFIVFLVVFSISLL